MFLCQLSGKYPKYQVLYQYQVTGRLKHLHGPPPDDRQKMTNNPLLHRMSTGTTQRWLGGVAAHMDRSTSVASPAATTRSYG